VPIPCFDPQAAIATRPVRGTSHSGHDGPQFNDQQVRLGIDRQQPARNGVTVHQGRTVFQAERVFTGERDAYSTNTAILVQDGRIVAVASQEEIGQHGDWASAPVVDAGPGKTLVPGLIDVHSHLIMPGDGTPYQELEHQDDSMLTLRALANARIALDAGVTTIVDTGTRGTVLYSLRDAIASGLVAGPRVILSGQPITKTGGHCWFLGGEADGVDGVRQMVRRLNKEGADIIKIMATGGGTERTYPFRPSYSQEEMTAAVDEAHVMGFKAFAHCSAVEGIQRAITAGMDVIFHCHFYVANGDFAYNSAITEQLVEHGIYVNPTLYVNRVWVDRLKEKQATEGLSPAEQADLDRRSYRYEGQSTNVNRLYEAGVHLIAGSDAGWGLTGFTDVKTELECMVDIGMSPVEALHSVTSQAARALGMEETIGTIAPGRQADFALVDGDPASDISALRNVDKVVLGGEVTGSA
jgi:imidazolonepropionase-like amidohydrolase